MTESEVADFIRDISAEIRGALIAGRYDPDPMSEDANRTISLYAARGAAAMVLEAGKRVEDAASFYRHYDAWLALVRDGNAPGLPKVTSSKAALPSSGYTRRPSQYPRHAFRRDEVQW